MLLSQFSLTRLALAALLALLVVGSAYRFRLLTRSGAVAAFALGLVVFGFGGWNWALILIGFFISSSGLSLLFKKKKKFADKMYAKGSRRDAGQVLANGGVAGAIALVSVMFPDSIIPWICFCSALAAANADTWATELGILNHKPPVMVLTGRPVEPGTSGAVSLVGTLAATAGAALIGLLAWLVNPMGEVMSEGLWQIGLVLITGVAGSFVDSIFGATVQAIYTCPNCKKETEQHPLHDCGKSTTIVRGWNWLNNDLVNFACTLSSSVLALILLQIIR
ncbi:MAG TPA: DUF92 domain-containing protein [Candidatus Limnocylindrales bacterium]|nr:DUF92 domain-containing protein [Candidatus Limnocylindrales bacterium]